MNVMAMQCPFCHLADTIDIRDGTVTDMALDMNHAPYLISHHCRLPAILSPILHLVSSEQ